MSPKYLPGTWDALDALRKKFPAPAFVYLEQVADGNKNRTADALVMSLWKSRGLWLDGFEVKASRQDWLKELKDPEKAEAFYQYCDHWWLVAASPDIVKEDELPETWGLMVLKGKKLYTEVKASDIDPKPMDRKFLAGFLRSASEVITPEEQLKQMKIDAREEGIEEGLRRAPNELKRWKDKAIRLEKVLDDFEEKSGVEVNTWSQGNIGEAFKVAMSLKRQKSITKRWGERALGEMTDIRRVVRGLMKSLDDIEEISGEQATEETG